MAPVEKKKRVNLSIGDKLELIKKLEGGVSVSRVCEIYGVKKQTVSDIRKAKDKLTKYAVKFNVESTKDKKGVVHARRHMKEPQSEALEEAVFKWYVQQRSVNVNVRGVELIAGAQKLANHMGIDFKASTGWLWRFRNRHGISNKVEHGEADSADSTAVEPYRFKLNELIKKEDLHSNQVYNAHETALFWRSLPKNTQAYGNEEKTPGKKISKEKFSVLLGANASGTHRLKPVVAVDAENTDVTPESIYMKEEEPDCDLEQVLVKMEPHDGQQEPQVIKKNEKFFSSVCKDEDFTTCDEDSLEELPAGHSRERNTGSSSTICKYCDFSCTRNDSMEEHIATKHDVGGLLECESCEYSCTGNYDLKRHQAAKHGVGVLIKCEICEYFCTQNYDMRRHQAAKHGIGVVIKCEFCEYSCAQKDDMKQHQAAEHCIRVKIKCELCDYTSGHSGYMKRHLATKHLCRDGTKCISNTTVTAGHSTTSDAPEEIAAVSDSVSGTTETKTTKCDSPQNPWPYLHDFFEYVSTGKDSGSMTFKCVQCLPMTKYYKAQKKSLFSLRKHIASIHAEMLTSFNACVKKGSKDHFKRKRDLSGERDYDDDEDERNAPKKQCTQLKMPQAMGLNRYIGLNACNKTLENKIMKFFIENVLPLRIVESSSFIDMIEYSSGKKFSMNRRTLSRKIEEIFEYEVTLLKEKLEGPLYVATTVDAWSCWNKSYLGVTVHWIDPLTLSRKKGVLACRRLKGKLTFNVLARAIEDIHMQFGIQDKTSSITSDNGSNFLKAFRLFGESEQECSQLQSTSCKAPQNESNCDSDVEDDADDTVIEDVATILDQGEQSSELNGEHCTLPRHIRCAAHTLNLIATTDAAAIMDNPGNQDYKKILHSAFSKAQALWNKQSQSPQAADIIREELGGQQFIIPGATSWKSFYDAVCRLNKVLGEKEGAVKNICKNLEIPSFGPVEITFFKEYEIVMSSLARSLDILQGEEKNYMGILVPTITVCLNLLQDVRKKELSVCGPLGIAIDRGIRKRFGQAIDDEHCLLAAAFHPHFKLKWMNNEEKFSYVLKKMALEVKSIATMSSKSSCTEIETDEDFFCSLSKNDERTNKKKDTSDEIKEWLKEPVINRSKHPVIHPAMFPNTTMERALAVMHELPEAEAKNMCAEHKIKQEVTSDYLCDDTNNWVEDPLKTIYVKTEPPHSMPDVIIRKVEPMDFHEDPLGSSSTVTSTIASMREVTEDCVEGHSRDAEDEVREGGSGACNTSTVHPRSAGASQSSADSLQSDVSGRSSGVEVKTPDGRGKPKLVCVLCDFTTDGKDTLREHLESKHKLGVSSKKESRGNSNVHLVNMKRNLEAKHSAENVLKCQTFDYRCSERNEIGEQEKHNSGKRFKCELCDYSSPSRVIPGRSCVRREPEDCGDSQSGSYRPPGGVDEMQGGDRRVRLEWGRILLFNIQ
ncbi:HTH CenpB-type DNA-binding domain [Trinorchestia longiramus]|nr:HTH CenpB-type DNA-binding domain [Trinorchestia longiramus]